VIPKVVEQMGSVHPGVHEAANELMFEFMLFPGDCTPIAEKAIKNGYFSRCLELLSATKPSFIREVLFSLSNMVAENSVCAQAFFQEEVLVDRLIEMTRNSNRALRGESLITLGNAVTMVENFTEHVGRYGSDLLETFARGMERFYNDKQQEKILKNSLEAVEVILFVGDSDLDPIMPKIFDALNQMQDHDDTDIHNYSKDLLERFFQAGKEDLVFSDYQQQNTNQKFYGNSFNI